MLRDFTKNSIIPYWISTVSLLIACVLVFVSHFQLCSEACAEEHHYRLYGFTFEEVGMILFPLITLIHLLSRWIPSFQLLTAWLLCAMLGGEAVFIYVQKYKIGSWCPVCLSIAAALTVAALAYLYEFYKDSKLFLQNSDRGRIMLQIKKSFAGIGFFILGSLVAFTGTAKHNPLQAAEKNLKEKIAFGNPNSHVEVYIFTDWSCPACRSLEPLFESMALKIMKNAKLTFVDDPVHPETLNYTPYNLSFMLNDKEKYFKLRNVLTKLSQETKTPNDEQVSALVGKLGVSYQQLNYSDVALANKYFTHLIKQMDVEGTPTVVVVNKSTQKEKKFPGMQKITEESIMKTVDSFLKQTKNKK